MDSFFRLYTMCSNFEKLASSIRVWHITTRKSADSIMSGGFIAQPTVKGSGVSVSANAISASSLLRTAQRMNSFSTKNDVINWYIEKGLPKEKAQALHNSYESRIMQDAERMAWRNNPSGLYLSMMADAHPATGGPADIPFEEFLWGDIGKNFIAQEVVAIEAKYTGPIPKNFRADGIEAEIFVTDMNYLTPIKILESPEGIINQ